MSDEELLVDVELMEAEEPAHIPDEFIRVGKKTKAYRAGKSGEAPTGVQVTQQFAACDRCSYFWAGYQLVDETFVVETAVDPDKPGWLQLTFSRATLDLIYKSFGNRVDLEFYHYEGCCPACKRPFVLHGGNDDTPGFRIRL